MSEVLTNARAILCAECHGLGMRTWPADTDTCRHCNGSGVQRGTCPGAAIRALGAGLKKALDEVERLRALIDNPGDHVQTWTPTCDQIVGIAHARTVTITIPSVTIRDHLRARLEAPND